MGIHTGHGSSDQDRSGRHATAPQLGQFTAPTHVIAHLSDTHLLADGAPLYGVVDTVARLDEAVARLRERGGTLDAIVVTGDVADRGEPDAYRRVRAAIDPVASAYDCPVVWVPGNHDERDAFRRGLLDQPGRGEEPILQVRDLDGLRLIALDSSVPGFHHGALDAGQLARLAAELADPAPFGTLLALHHPPLPTPLGAMTVLELRGLDEFASIIRGTDVRGILAGHLHYPTSALFGGVPVFVAGATSYTMDLAAPVRTLTGRDGAQSFSLIQVHPETVLTAAVPTAAAAIATRFDESLLDALEATDDRGRIDLFSRMPDAAD